MKNLFLSLVLFFFSTLSAEPIQVLVSVAPYLEIVKCIGGTNVEAKMLVPEGIDSHSFEPSPETLKATLKGKIWFTVGECFEARVARALSNQNPSLKVCDLRLALPDSSFAHAHDPHIWMSVKLMILQASFIEKALVEAIPEAKEEIHQNTIKLLQALHALDSSIQEKLGPKKGFHIATAHPSYTLFCNDYGLQQLALESEYKEPTMREIAAFIKKLKALKIETIFTQSEYGHKGAEAIAQELHGRIEYLPDLSPHYFEMMNQIANAFEKESR